jgi:hypothetical protein
MHAADARSRQLMSELDAIAAPSQDFRHEGVTPLLGLPGDGQRLAFGKAMSAAAAHKIMPPSTHGAKAVAVSGTAGLPQQFVADPVKLGRPPTSLLSALPVTVQSSPQFAYLRQSVRTNAAAIVAEGALKPTSTYTVVRIEDKLDVFAHLSEALPRMWIADSPALQQFLSNELTYGLALAVEAMALADIVATSGIQSNSFSTSVLQTLRKSVTKLEANGYPPATFVLHSNDWETTELAVVSAVARICVTLEHNNHLCLPSLAGRTVAGVGVPGGVFLKHVLVFSGRRCLVPKSVIK